MESNEFERWIEDYQARNHWVGEMLAASGSLVDDWHAGFIQFTLEEMQEATRYVMTLDPQPTTENHFPKLLSFLKAQRFKPLDRVSRDNYSGSPRSYRCLDCRDLGSFEVYQPRAYEPIRRGTFSISLHLRSIVVACHCESGKQHTENHRSPMKKFSRNTMCKIKAATIAEQVLELTEFVTDHYKPERYFSEFSEFANV